MSQRSALSSLSAIWLPRSTALPKASSNGCDSSCMTCQPAGAGGGEWSRMIPECARRRGRRGVEKFSKNSMLSLSLDPGLGECVEHGAKRARHARVTCLEPHGGPLEGIAMLSLRERGIRFLEHATDVAEQRLEHCAILRIEALGALQFLVQVAEGVLKFAHGLYPSVRSFAV